MSNGSGRASCTHNLKQIGLALHDYEAAWDRLPPAIIRDKQGKPMHSWRTLILPYVGKSPLYSAMRGSIDLRQGWNGPKNSALAAMLVRSFRCPDDPSIQGRPMTSYVAVTGPGTAWDEPRSHGTPQVMVVEVANSNIHWMEPRDLTLEDACRSGGNGSGLCLASRHKNSGGFFFQDEVGTNALFSDGKVYFIPAGLSPETLRGVFTGDEAARRACEEYPLVCQYRINWTNWIALAVFVSSYVVLLVRTRCAGPASTDCRTEKGSELFVGPTCRDADEK
jgi:hypothetical protein